MLFGSHVSIAGGVFNAPDNAATEDCEVFQIFTRSPRGGAAPKLTAEILKQFRDNNKKHGYKQFYVHAPYYINLASADKKNAAASVRIIREELERSSILGVEALMIHTGSARDLDRKTALANTVANLKQVVKGYTGSTQFLLEIAAGSGNVIGDTFDEIGYLIKQVQPSAKKPIGVCFDTCHAFASGYDLRTKTAVEKTLKEFDKKIGLAKLKLFHFNDSKGELGSRLDRHEHIGQGKIGLECFKTLINHPKLKKVNAILETHKEGNWAKKNLQTLMDLRKQ